MSLFYILLILSFPVFYVLGLVTFIRFLVREIRTNPKKERLKKLKEQLSSLVSYQDQQTVSSLKSDYEHQIQVLEVELHDSTGIRAVNTSSTPPIAKVGIPGQEKKKTIGESWLSLGSINILLYLGAFLIVSSALIFISFQWESWAGVVKAFVFTLFTTIFLLAGSLFHQFPKIKQAGVTFIAIGNILIPFGGLAWYNFYFQDAGASFFTVWLMTSALTLVVGILCAYNLRSQLYFYFSSFGLFSLMVSVLNLVTTEKMWALFIAIVTSLILQVVRIGIKRQKDSEYIKGEKALRVSADIILFLTILWGFMTALSSQALFSLPFALSLVLFAFYYALLYWWQKENGYLFITEIVFPLSLVFLFRSFEVHSLVIIYLLAVLVFNYVLVTLYFHLQNNSVASRITYAISLLYTFLSVMLVLGGDYQPIHEVVLFTLPVLWGIVLTWGQKKPVFIIQSAFFLMFVIERLVNQVWHFSWPNMVLVISYLTIGTAFYLGALSFYQKRKDWHLVLLGSGIFYLIVAWLLATDSVRLFWIANLVWALVLVLAAYVYKLKFWIYFSNLALLISLVALLNDLSVNRDYFPLVLIFFTAFIYLVSYVWTAFQKEYRFTGYALFYLLPFIFMPLFSKESSLVSWYLVSGGLILDALFTNHRLRKYLSSAYVMMSYLVSVNYWYDRINEPLAYFIPLGFYFLGLGYCMKREGRIFNQRFFQILGFMVIILTTFIQTLDTGNVYYSILLGGLGLAFLFVGISYEEKLYTGFGIMAIIAALLSQLYEYVFSLPRWLVTGIVGLSFLTLAIILLLKRKEED